jgi:hypothetical protein
MEQFGADEPLQLAYDDQTEETAQTGAALTNNNTKSFENKLSTCKGDNDIGCVQITFMKAVPASVDILNEIAAPGSPGLFAETPWVAPSGWLCGEESVQRVCPSANNILSSVGGGCEGGATKEEFFTSMHSENDTMTWVLRAILFFCVYCTVSCIFSPITTIVDMVMDGAEYITDWIPCVGTMVECIGDIISGVVGCIVFCISLFFATSCFCIVAGTVWVAMRPKIGIPCFILACCCFGGGIFACHSSRKSKRKGRQGLGGESEDEMHNSEE